MREYRHAQVVTPHATSSLPAICRLWVGGAGNVNVITDGGETVLISGLQTGSMTPEGLGIARLLVADTTATLIVAVW